MDESLRVYTTRPDTLFGATYMVVSPEHPIIEKHADLIKNIDAVRAYQQEAAKKSDFERTELNKDKTGVCLDGITAINPVNGREIPVWVSDYVLVSYGTGAIMAVPAHDTRDWEFAHKFGLPVIEVVAGGDVTKEAYTDIADGVMVNSGFLDGLTRGGCEEKDDRIPDREGHRREEGQLQAPRLGVLPSALLGRTHSGGLVREVRLRAAAGGSAAR